MSFYQLALLMWKSYRLRLHHWIATIFEILLAIFVILAVVFLSLSDFSSQQSDSSGNDTISTLLFASVAKSELIKGAGTTALFYAPSRISTDKFMKGMDNFFLIKGLKDDVSLRQAVQHPNTAGVNQSATHVVGIHFLNGASLTFVKKLKYTLIEGNLPDTNELYNKNPLQEIGYAEKASTFVQLLLNENFIKYKLGNSSFTNTKLEFEAFPLFEEKKKLVLIEILFFYIIVIVFISSYTLIKDIIEERESGVKELMKMTGLHESTIWLGWLVHASIVNIISLSAAIIILKVTLPKDYESLFLLWLLMMFYSMATVSFCFMFSSIFHNVTIASSIFMLCFLSMVIGTSLIQKYIPHLIMCLYPMGSLYFGIEEIEEFERRNIKFTFSNIIASQSEESGIPLLVVLLMLLFDMLLYFFLTYYITVINPGKFGVGKSPLFLFQLFSKEKEMHSIEKVDKKLDPKFFEEPPTHLMETIKIRDLHKHFSSVYAVKGVNLNVYQGELTGLLGHNGAGKTTLMSIMTGFTTPSAGSIRYNNTNIFERMDAFRKKVGLCPQENRSLSYLTVMDHLLFFGKLKGSSHEDAFEEASKHLWIMNMTSKADFKVKDLSGGMKRKLSLGIALMGNSEVLILDEPTSGMDAESRRNLWDIILQMRGKRTIIFTTHYMDEADILGDRIAIMNQGIVVCHGTSTFLKNAYGAGYQLKITKDNGNTNTITELITDVLPDAELQSEKSFEIMYRLPLDKTDKFPDMFENLEAQRESLGIQEMGVSATTMEDVFFKAGGASTHILPSTNVENINESASYSQITGAKLVFAQISAILKKKFLYSTRDLYSIFVKVILSTVFAVLFLHLVLTGPNRPPKATLNTSMTTYPRSIVVLQSKQSDFDKYIKGYIKQHDGIIVESNHSKIEQALVEYGQNDISKYEKHYISAFVFNPNFTKILFNQKLKHSLPITINTYSNALLRTLMKNESSGIETGILPVDSFDYRPSNNDRKYFGCYDFEQGSSVVLWYFALALLTVDLLSYFLSFVSMERVEGFYHIQMISRVSPPVYWVATFLFDLLFFLAIIFLRTMVFKFVDHIHLLSFAHALGVFYLMVVLYGMSGLMMIYISSYFTKSKEGPTRIFFLINVASIALIILQNIVARDSSSTFFRTALYYSVHGIILIIPTFNFSILVYKMLIITIANTQCMYCHGYYKQMCESSLKKLSYYEYPSKKHPDGLLLGLMFLAIDFLVLLIILLLLNAGYLSRFVENVKKLIYGTQSSILDAGDSDVQQEIENVQQYLHDDSKKDKASLIVDNLRKNYIRWMVPHSAVANVSFAVEHGQCFGLLGVNGAGKTTTFRMLTAEVIPTLGDSYIERTKMSVNKFGYLYKAGYCAQTNCFIERLTGQEMLNIIATMRGVLRSDRQKLVDKWISVVGLEPYRNRRCGDYSGGNKRKLCTAMALIGDPRVAFLDEPTSGVDPVSRRNLYDVMTESRAAGQSIILTSHSMEECENLCDRLTIMVKGVMKCIGTTQHLKSRYALGFSVLIKTKDDPEVTDEIPMLKHLIEQVFNPKYTSLKDQHANVIYYQITDTTLEWSTLFRNMENIKISFSKLIKEYVLSDTTLEEVFISLAKSGSNSSK